MSERRFPGGFLWGVATAGHQNEGGNTTSDTWFAENVTPTVFREPSGKACNSYELWREDVELVAGMGLNAYRFSVEWARIEPAEGEFSDRGLDHYEAVARRCRELGIAPVVTFNHFTCPHWFAARGGWLDERAAPDFARYCGAVADRLGDQIEYAVTLNEPNLPRLLGWLDLPPVVRDLERATLDAVGREAGVERYRLANVVLAEDLAGLEEGLAAAHVAGKAAIKDRLPGLPVGLSVAVVDDQVVGDDPAVRDRKRRDVYQRWLELARDDDYVGVQNYDRACYDGSGLVPPPAGLTRNQMGGDVHAPSLAGAVRYAHDVAGVPVLVTEHGVAIDDDAVRAAFVPEALAGLLGAVEGGVPVLGYLHWTLLDNFEWIFGYSHRLGLHEVDRTTFARTPKPSAGIYSAIARAGALPAAGIGA